MTFSSKKNLSLLNKLFLSEHSDLIELSIFLLANCTSDYITVRKEIIKSDIYSNIKILLNQKNWNNISSNLKRHLAFFLTNLQNQKDPFLDDETVIFN